MYTHIYSYGCCCVTVHVYVQMSTYMYYTKCDMYVQKSHMYLQIDMIYIHIYIYAFKLQFKESISLIYILMSLQPCHMEFFHKTFFLLRGGRAKNSLKLDVFFKMFYHLNVVFLEHFFDSRTSNLLPLDLLSKSFWPQKTHVKVKCSTEKISVETHPHLNPQWKPDPSIWNS